MRGVDYKVKKTVSVLLSMALMLALIAGLAAPGLGTAEQASEPPTKIRIMLRVNAEVNFDNSQLVKAIETAANVELEYDIPPISSYVDRLALVMASGDLPDIIYTWRIDSVYAQWAKDGLIMALDDLVGAYPNLMSNISPETWEVTRTSTTGNIHAVPKTNKLNYYGYLVNQEWLDKLGFEIPKTIADFYEFGKAVATQDPDGNGKDDTYLISPVGNGADGALWTDAYLLMAFNLRDTKGRADTDGQFKIREKFAGYWPYLDFLCQLYEEKIMDPEFFLNETYKDAEKQQQNKVAVANHQETAILGYVAAVPDALTRFTFAAPPTWDDSPVTLYFQPPTWGAFMIPEGAKNVDKLLQFLDWGNSEEGYTMMNVGVEGIHYETYDINTRVLTRTEEQAKLGSTEISGYASFAYAFNGREPVAPGATEAEYNKYITEFTAYKELVRTEPVLVAKSPLYDTWAANNPDLFTKRGEMELRYVLGEITKDELQAFLDNEFFPKIADAEQEYIAIMTAAAAGR